MNEDKLKEIIHELNLEIDDLDFKNELLKDENERLKLSLMYVRHH